MGRKKAKNRDKAGPTRRLFRDPSGQGDLFEKSREEELEAKRNEPVECLGITFENDDARRAYFTEKLREKLKDPEFRKIEGFPIGDDEDILRLSDPPYYTACPNPFVADFVRTFGRAYDPDETYTVEPYAVDITQTRNNPYVNAHSYATKVPPQAVLRFLLHYTKPGDVVYDGYCGTGMTAVAAQLAECPSSDLRATIDDEWSSTGKGSPAWGRRACIVGDLSAAATFIASNLTSNDDLDRFAVEAQGLLRAVEAECSWMYKTRHTDGTAVDFSVCLWSDVFACPQCSEEVVFWDSAVDVERGRLLDKFPCGNCGAMLAKRGLPRAYVSQFDAAMGSVVRKAKRVPVAIVYTVDNTKYEKLPDAEDLALIRQIETEKIESWFPVIPMMHKGAKWGDTWRAGVHDGISHLHQFFTTRNLRSLALAWSLADSNRLKFVLTALMYKSSILCGPLMSNYFAERKGGSRGGWVGKERSGTLFRPSIASEVPIHRQIRSRISSVAVRARCNNAICIQTTSASQSNIPCETVDYIFIDPPFGANRYYSELNFMWEAWLGVFTEQTAEAVEGPSQGKTLRDYQDLMESGFRECYRILKPGRWITIEFSNTSAAVWNAIQAALSNSRFVVADVRALSKGQGSINAYTTPTAVKQDLVISAYKLGVELERRIKLEAGSEHGAWGFVRAHLRQLPVFVEKEGKCEVIAERQSFMLFDRMVAFHVQRGISVPMSAAEFYAGLAQRFPERDGMYFLPEQAGEYDRKRMSVKEILQLQLFVTDEASAIQWIKQQLSRKPQTIGELTPRFMQEIGGWQKHEKPLELREVLEENFLCYEGDGEVPSQIHSYLSSNWPDLRKKAKDDPALRAKAKNRWYVPDPGKAQDLEKLRERALLREFWEYVPSGYAPSKPESAKGYLPGFEQKPSPIPRSKRIKVIRMEAVRAGFKHCWQHRDYRTIIAVARRIPDNVLQEDPKLLMWYDQALTRMGGD